MKVSVQLVIECDDDVARTSTIACMERSRLSPADLGLHLAEARSLLRNLQGKMIGAQIAELERGVRLCPECGALRHRNGRHKLVYRTVFGRLALDSPRFFACRNCTPDPRTSQSPLAELLTCRTSPELQYLQAKFASLMSYGLTLKVLGEILPLDHVIAATSARRCVAQVGARLDLLSEQVTIDCDPDERPLIPPAHPVRAIGIDGGYVKRAGCKGRSDGWFEVMVAKSERYDRPGKSMAYVHCKVARTFLRFRHFLATEGVRPSDPVTIISDGGLTVRQAQAQIGGCDELILDWFHVAMRIQNMMQVAKGLDGEHSDQILKDMERIKWHLWHGCPSAAEERLDWLIADIEARAPNESQSKLLRMAEEFAGYIANNTHAIADYGERFRNGDIISSSFAESAINQVISRRMVKKQQMAWSPDAAHNLLQVRTAVLNDDLKVSFDQWFPKAA